MKLHLQYLKTRGPATPISYQLDYTIEMKLEIKVDSLKVNMKTQSGETGSETVSLYVLVFRTGSPEACIKFHTTIQKITRCQSIKTGLQMYATTKNLLAGEALRVFEQQEKTNGNKTKENFKMVI